jgi:hypothetical protein
MKARYPKSFAIGCLTLSLLLLCAGGQRANLSQSHDDSSAHSTQTSGLSHFLHTSQRSVVTGYKASRYPGDIDHAAGATAGAFQLPYLSTSGAVAINRAQQYHSEPVCACRGRAPPSSFLS